MTDLENKDFIGLSDPYVKFELVHDNVVCSKSYGEHKSSIKTDELNPIYDETFTFENITTVILENLELKMKMWDDDHSHKLTDDKLGACTIKLESLGLTSGVPVEGSWKLLDTKKDAKIFLTLTWNDN